MMSENQTAISVLQSMELYAEVVGDPTSAVYERFFAAHPEAVEEFAGDEALKARMMARVLQMFVDLADGDVAPESCGSWVSDHADYGVNEKMAFVMFGVIVETIRVGLGELWTPEMDGSWNGLIESLRPTLNRAFEN